MLDPFWSQIAIRVGKIRNAHIWFLAFHGLQQSSWNSSEQGRSRVDYWELPDQLIQNIVEHVSELDHQSSGQMLGWFCQRSRNQGEVAGTADFQCTADRTFLLDVDWSHGSRQDRQEEETEYPLTRAQCWAGRASTLPGILPIQFPKCKSVPTSQPDQYLAFLPQICQVVWGHSVGSDTFFIGGADKSFYVEEQS